MTARAARSIPSTAKSATGTSRPGALTLAAIALATLIGFVLPPTFGPLAVVPTFLIRGALAGTIAGLSLRRDARGWLPPALAAASALVGTPAVAALSTVTPNVAATIVSAVAAATCAVGFAHLAPVRRGIPAQALAIALLITAMLWTAGVFPSEITRTVGAERELELTTVPQPEQYAFDGHDYLRIYCVMRQGAGYYEAFEDGVLGDSRHDRDFLTSPFSYREPFVFYLWQALPGAGGMALLWWFVVYACLTTIAAYRLACRLTDPGPALLAPAGLLSYYSWFFWSSSWFTITEVWAAGFGVAAVCCLVADRRATSVLLLVLAVAAREFMVLLIPAWLLAWYLAPRRRESWWLPIASVLGPVAVLAAHYLAAPDTVAGASTVSNWLKGGSDRLVAALRFGYDLMPAGRTVALLVAVLAILAALLARPRSKTAALLAVTVLPTLFLYVFSAGTWHYYWGGFYTPIALAIAPGAFGRILPPRQPSARIDTMLDTGR